MAAHNSVGWFEIYVQDVARARAFYEAVFQVTLESLEPAGGDLEMWAFPMTPDSVGASGALVKMEGMPSGGNSTIVYFICDDCANEAKAATKNGGRIFKDKFSIGEYGFIALVHDTEGNMIGLHSME
jgi:predicted enzyme related to lactoylglutathione lyase